ncbi:MAG: putative Rossmann fold flavoprotein [Halioglobus sp.]
MLVLEKSNKVGKKILMSGGGRCNFTNHFFEPNNFISHNEHFCKSALSRYTQWDFIAMVEKHGIEYEERKHSQLFCTGSAAEILTMLLSECESAGVTINTHCDTQSLSINSQDNDDERYQLEVIQKTKDSEHSRSLRTKTVVIATGALSIPTLGGSAMGYDIAQQYHLTMEDRRAGLVPFMFSDSLKDLCVRLTGLATEVEISCNGRSFSESMLFTHRGLSGPAILQISSYWFPGDAIFINLLPQTDGAQWLLQQKEIEGKKLLRSALASRLSKALVNELQTLFWQETAEAPLAQYSDQALRDIGKHLNQWQLKPSGTEGYRTAEVTLGGVSTQGISSKTMESKENPGLYFVGEVLDVTGHLGGFNFQWAWSSGYSAGLVV